MTVTFTSSPNVLSGLNEGVTMPLHKVSLNRDTAAGIGCATRISFNAGGILVSVCVLLTKHWILDRKPGDISPYRFSHFHVNLLHTTLIIPRCH